MGFFRLTGAVRCGFAGLALLLMGTSAGCSSDCPSPPRCPANQKCAPNSSPVVLDDVLIEAAQATVNPNITGRLPNSTVPAGLERHLLLARRTQCQSEVVVNASVPIELNHRLAGLNDLQPGA